MITMKTGAVVYFH